MWSINTECQLKAKSTETVSYVKTYLKLKSAQNERRIFLKRSFCRKVSLV